MKESTTGRTLFLISVFVGMTFMITVDMSTQWYRGDEVSVGVQDFVALVNVAEPDATFASKKEKSRCTNTLFLPRFRDGYSLLSVQKPDPC